MDTLSTAAAMRSEAHPDPEGSPSGVTAPLPPVLGRLLRGSFWLALRSPLQALIAFWTVPLTFGYIGPDAFGAYGFAWGFGFLQFLLEFGMSSALQRQVSDAWTRGDRRGVDRAVACGTLFYAVAAAIQAATLVAIATWGVPHSGYRGDSSRLIVRLLWLQAIVAPAYGLSVVTSSVLQAARRYEFVPRLDLLVVVLRFAILGIGIAWRVDFLWIVVAQVILQVGLTLAPALWVMVNDLGIVPRFRGASWDDFRGLFRVSLYVFLIQLSVVLADRIDTTILGFALPEGIAGPATAVYLAVSKAFLQIRQTGWTLCYLVMPAVASLAAARDREGLDRILYDGSRLLIGILVPVALLAAIDARPFLHLWMGPEMAAHAGLMQLFLVAALPLVISVLVQISIGLGRVEVIAYAALGGALVNLPLSYVLTTRIGVAGVIWGTVLTTLVSNLLIPGWYVVKTLDVSLSTFAQRALSAPVAGGLALIAAVLAARALGFGPTGPAIGAVVPFVAELVLGCLAYAAGYLATPAGRMDLTVVLNRLRGRSAA
jgi:O-antigen/teichoic acid export membrane protein